MELFNEYPYRNLTDLNLDYLEKKMKVLEEIINTFVTLNTVTFADPIIWNITTQYARNTVVLDTAGNAYLSKEAVPAGVQLNNSDYWLEIFNFTEYTRTANQNLTINVETNTTRATHAYNVDDWLIWNDVLYKVTSAIAVDDTLIVGTNIVHFTVEDFIKAFMTWATNTIQQYKNNIDASELAYKNDIDASELAYQSAMQAEVDRILAGATVDSEVIDARMGYEGTNYTTLGKAVRTQAAEAIDGFNIADKTIVKNGVENYEGDYVRNELEFTDSNKNIVMAIDYDRQIVTPNFDSGNVRNLTVTQETSYDLSFKDSNGNVIMGIKDGKLIANDFVQSALSGKKVSILGDSISTYSGYLPTGYVSYYPNGDVDTVYKTWWKKAIEALGGELLVNASWTSSRVTGNSLDSTGFCGCSTKRINDLASGGVDPDVVICFIGTNDWYLNVTLGTFTPTDDIPTDGTINTIAEAYALMLYKIVTTYPNARIYCVTALEGRIHPKDSVYPVVNSNGNTVHELNHTISEIAHIFGANVIDLTQCGINYFNKNSFTVDNSTHPNAAGMDVLYNKVTKCFIDSYYQI